MSNSVSAELEALRKSGSVKQHASALKSKSGALSTPEAEEATLAKLKKDDKEKKREAVEGLRNTKAAGGGLVEEELKKVGDRKKQFEKGRSEAKLNLNKGASGGKGSVVAAADASSVPAETAEVEDNEKQSGTEAAEVEVKEAPTSQVESAQDDNDDDDDDVPDLEEADTEPTQPANAATQQQTTNRNEKKVRKIMSRLDMRPVPSIVRAVMKTSSGNFVIERPDVFASGSKGNETYVLFGEARQQQPLGLRKNAPNPAAEAARVLQEAEPVVEDKVQVAGGDEDLDVEGLEAKDIELVMAQASCEKSVAVKALKENDGDLVNAIMSLTT